MDMNLNVLRLAGELAAHATARQVLVTENIAHADTPGYRARDIEDFGTVVEEGSLAFQPRQTRPGHLDFGTGAHGFKAEEITAFGAETPNGNTVALEDQMMRAAEVRQSHDLALGVYSKTMDILRANLAR